MQLVRLGDRLLSAAANLRSARPAVRPSAAFEHQTGANLFLAQHALIVYQYLCIFSHSESNSIIRRWQVVAVKDVRLVENARSR